MATATVTRGGTSVTFDIYDEGGGSVAVARDIGKPELEFQNVARANPRSFDGFSALDVFTVTGQLTGSNAYSNAQTLAEDIVKSHSDGTTTTLDLSSVTGLSTYDVAFNSENNLRLAYPPGRKDWVSLQLQATVVRGVVG